MERRSTSTPSALGEEVGAEGDLLAKARGGNLFAFEEIVNRYQRRVYGVALRIVRRHHVADDVAQEAFIRAYQALHRFDPARPFGPWICRIAANLAVNHVRSPEARETALPEGHAETPSAAADPLGSVLEGETRAVVSAALDALPAEQRAVLVLRAVEGFSYREIAESLGISPGTVMSRLFRARRILREELSSFAREAGLLRGGSEE